MPSGFGAWSARITRPGWTIFEKEFCQQAKWTFRGFGSEVLPHLLKRVWLRAPAGSTHRCDHEIENNCCLGAAQLMVAPDKTPNAAPAGRAGSFSARRTASRRLQTLPPVTPLVAASGAPP